MKNSPKIMLLFGIIAFAVIMIIINENPIEKTDPEFWFYRVLAALASASISISIPGMLQINYNPDGQGINLMTDEKQKPIKMTLAEKEPMITASGAIAIFILVYLFNPIG